MKKKVFLVLALLFMGLLAFTPSKTIAQAVPGPDQTVRPQQERSSTTRQQTDQSVQATVTGVDRPQGCLRIRQQPSSSSEIIGCAKINENLQLTGKYSGDGRWAELADKGWVFAAQIDAPNKPKVQRQARRSYESDDTEDLYIEPSDSSLWREPASSYYGTDAGVVYGGSYGYGQRFGFGSGWRHQGGGHRGVVHQGGGHRGRR